MFLHWQQEIGEAISLYKARKPCQSYIMPPMSGIAGFSFSGLSATTASVVRNIAATDAAFCSAERVTLQFYLK